MKGDSLGIEHLIYSRSVNSFALLLMLKKNKYICWNVTGKLGEILQKFFFLNRFVDSGSLSTVHISNWLNCPVLHIGQTEMTLQTDRRRNNGFESDIHAPSDVITNTLR